MLVHLLEFGTDIEDNFNTFLFGHLHVTQADLSNVVADVETHQEDVPINLVSSGSEGYGQRVGRVLLQLDTQTVHIGHEIVYLMIETVDLGGQADDTTEGIQIVIEFLLEFLGSFHLFLDPDMAGAFQQHGTLLRLEFFLGFVGVHVYHACQRRVNLCLHLLVGGEAKEEQKGKDDSTHTGRG